MTQADRDRLVTLKKASKKLITQRQAAEELGLSVRHVKRLLRALKQHGDKAVVHGLRGKTSNRRIEEETEKDAVKILSAAVYAGFGPTLAAEYLANKHGIEASKETVRRWMIRAKLWRAKEQKVRQVHMWRPRRSRFGELVQWDNRGHPKQRLGPNGDSVPKKARGADGRALVDRASAGRVGFQRHRRGAGPAMTTADSSRSPGPWAISA